MVFSFNTFINCLTNYRYYLEVTFDVINDYIIPFFPNLTIHPLLAPPKTARKGFQRALSAENSGKGSELTRGKKRSDSKTCGMFAANTLPTAKSASIHTGRDTQMPSIIILTIA